MSNSPSRRTVLKVSGGLGLAGLVPVAALAEAAQAPYSLPVNLDNLVAGQTTQVVLAMASAFRSPKAVVSAWSRQADGSWLLAYGPYDSWIGPKGFAKSGTKREGDLHTPTGTFGIPLAFGTKAKPAGMRLPFTKLTPPFDIWVENPKSKYYNELVDTRRVSRKAIGDKENPVLYPLGAFIAYNSRRVPGLGSAIFLHPSHNSPTIGCVSIGLAQLTTVLKWLNPSATPAIVMGVQQELLFLGGAVPVPTPTLPITTAPPTDSPSPSPTDTSTPSPSPTDTGSPSPSPSDSTLVRL